MGGGCERTRFLVFQTFGKNKNTQGWDICDKDGILTVQQKGVALIENKKISLEMNPCKRQLQERRYRQKRCALKNKSKKKNCDCHILLKKMLKVFIGEVSKGYERKNQRQNNKIL